MAERRWRGSPGPFGQANPLTNGYTLPVGTERRWWNEYRWPTRKWTGKGATPPQHPAPNIWGPYPTTVLQDSPILYYRLGDAQGTPFVKDDSGFGRDITSITAVTFQQVNAFPTDPNTSALFNGSTSQLTQTTYTVPASDFSVEFWVMANGAWTGSNQIVGFAGNGSFDNYVQIDNTGFIQASIVLGGIPTILQGGTIHLATNDWHQVVVTFSVSHTRGRVYIDGALAQETTTSGAFSTSAGVYIANDPLLSSFFKGFIQDVSFYPSELTPARILTHYQVGAPTHPIPPMNTSISAAGDRRFLIVGAGKATPRRGNVLNIPLIQAIPPPKYLDSMTVGRRGERKYRWIGPRRGKVWEVVQPQANPITNGYYLTANHRERLWSPIRQWQRRGKQWQPGLGQADPLTNGNYLPTAHRKRLQEYRQWQRRGRNYWPVTPPFVVVNPNFVFDRKRRVQPVFAKKAHQWAPVPSPQYVNGITNVLQILPQNRYWLYDVTGKAVVLAGSHTWNTLQDIGLHPGTIALNFDAYVNFLLAHGHNATILWHRDLPTYFNWGANGGSSTWDMYPWPWSRSGAGNAADGKPKFDLNTFDQAFFDRLLQRVRQLGANNIYAIVQLFDGYHVNNNRSSNADGHPLTANATGGQNNVNSIDDGYTSGTAGNGAYNMSSANSITTVQDALIQKFCDTLQAEANVIFEVDEEATSGAWNFFNNHVADKVHTYEQAQGYILHPVFQACSDLLASDNSNLNGSHAEIVSSGDKFGAPLYNNHPDMNDSDHSYFNCWNDTGGPSGIANRQFVWENFCNGVHPLFMDPYLVNWPSSPNNRNTNIGTITNGLGSHVDPQWDLLRNNLGQVVSFGNTRIRRLGLMTPQPSIASTGHCLANLAPTQGEILVYQSSTGAFTVNLSKFTGRTLSVTWLDCVALTITTGSQAGGSASQSMTPPNSNNDFVLLLQDPTPDFELPPTSRNRTDPWRLARKWAEVR